MSGPCDQFVMEDQSCDCFDMVEYAESFDMGINFLLGPPTPSEVIFIPSVNEDGDLSWSNNGGLPNPPTVNIKGPPGSSPVQSVNGKTGEVSLDKTDIGLRNVANVLQYSANNPPPYPVTSVNGQTGAVKLPYANKNLLDNWYFVGGGSQGGWGKFPINQRGQTSYSADGYTIDRWSKTAVGVASLVSGGVSISADMKHFMQPLAEDLSGKQVTLSALFSDGTLRSGTGVYPQKGSANVDVLTSSAVNLYLAYPSSGSPYIGFYCKQAFTIVAVKLELGSSQTLAHQESGAWVLNEVPDFGEQLAVCQKYLYIIKSTGNKPLPLAWANSATVGVVTIPFKQTMAKAPTFSSNNANAILLTKGAIASGFNITSASLATASEDFAELSLSASNMTAASAYRCIMQSGGELIFSAEL